MRITNPHPDPQDVAIYGALAYITEAERCKLLSQSRAYINERMEELEKLVERHLSEPPL